MCDPYNITFSDFPKSVQYDNAALWCSCEAIHTCESIGYILKVSNQHQNQLFSLRLYYNGVHWCSSPAVHIHVHDLIGKYSHKVLYILRVSHL